MSGFGVHDEWGALREVAIGDRPALERLLTSEGVTVRRCTAALPRDPLIVVGDRLIEAALRFEDRAAERFAMRPLAQSIAQERGVPWSSAPPGWPNGVDGPFLEGGDVLLNGREIYVGMSGRATDMAGIDWLERHLGSDYRVIPVAMRSSVRHLEDVLALVRPGVLVWCADLLIDGLPTSLRTWDSIRISIPESDQRSTHLLILEPGRAVADSTNVRVAAELRARGIEILSLPLADGLRAAHLPLLRESELE